MINRNTNRVINVLTTILFIVLYLLESDEMGGTGMVIVAALITAIIFLTIVIENKGKLPICIGRFHIHVVLMIAFCIVSSLWAFNTYYPIVRGVTILEVFICMAVIYIHYCFLDNINDLLNIIMWGGYLTVIMFFVISGPSVVISMVLSGSRMTNDFLNANVFGILAATSICLNFYYIFFKRKYMWALILAVLAVMAILVSQSKKSIIFLAMGIFFAFVLRRYQGDKFKLFVKAVFWIMILGIALYGLSKVALFTAITERMIEMVNTLFNFNGAISTSDRVRLSLSRLGIQLFKEHPILGVGIDNAKFYALNRLGLDLYLHNNYAELLAGGGIVGFICYYSMYVYCIGNMIKYRRLIDDEYKICLVLIVIKLVMEYGSVSYYGKTTYFYIMLYFLEVENLKRRNDKERKLSTN